ncbi:RNA recognition motif domain, partial [Trinorchestia longiramus]
MAKTTVKPRSGEKDSLLAISKKSKSLEKKTSKKNSTIKSPEAKKVSLAVKKERKNVQKKKEAADINTEAIDASPEKEIKLKSKVLLKPKSKAPENKSNRFDEIKKIHKVLQGKKLMKLKREQEDKDSDESADEDDEACKSYAQDFGMDDDENSIDGSEDEQSQENNVEPKKTKDAKLEKTKDAKPKKTKDAKPKKTKDAKPEKGTDANPEEGMDVDPEESTEAKPKMKREFVDANDPEEQARTVLIKNVSMKTSRRQITHLMSPYGKVVSVRIKASAVKTQVKLKQFKKEATSCCAYVKFVLPEQATAALAANGS